MAEPADYPVKEQIVQAVVAALQGITIENGYKMDIGEVERPVRDREWIPRDRGAAVLQQSDVRDSEGDAPGNPPAVGWMLTLSIDLVVRISEHNETPVSQILNVMEADVRKALSADQSFGGLAILSELGDTDYAESDPLVEGVTVWIDIKYSVSQTDPYENRR